MTTSKTIEILITPDGQSTVQTQGFTGAECQSASRFLEEALGQRVSEELTPEFYQTQTHSESQQQRN